MESVEVSIYGQSYSLRTENNQEEIMQIASMIDTKMRDLASKLSMSSTAKLAILAALNLLYEQKNDQVDSGQVAKLEKPIDDMIADIENCLAN